MNKEDLLLQAPPNIAVIHDDVALSINIITANNRDIDVLNLRMQHPSGSVQLDAAETDELNWNISIGPNTKNMEN